jgi:S1 RNA binding domain protein
VASLTAKIGDISITGDNLSFEDMMSRFKSQSEEKMADLDHETNNRRGGGYAPRGRRGSR